MTGPDGRPVIGIATTQLDCEDPRSWSGLPYSMHRAFLRRDEVTVNLLGPLPMPWRGVPALRKGWYRLRGMRYRWEMEPHILDRYRPELARRLEEADPDAVLCLGSTAHGSLPAGMPATYYADATLNLNTDYYPTFTGVAPRSQRQGEDLEQMVFRRAAHVVAASDWAAADMVASYGVAPDAVTVLPIGAQHECSLDAEELRRIAATRLKEPMRLLWMGVEWERKGGDIALATAEELRRRGVPVRLDLAGRVPDEAAEGRDFVHSHGFVDRRTRGDLIDELFLNSFALLLPSRAENSSVVLADAASHALPSVTSETGGMATMVHNDVNGRRVRVGGGPSDYADVLEGWWSDQAAYLELCARSRHRFETELNWDVIVGRMTEVVLEHPVR